MNDPSEPNDHSEANDSQPSIPKVIQPISTDEGTIYVEVPAGAHLVGAEDKVGSGNKARIISEDQGKQESRSRKRDSSTAAFEGMGQVPAKEAVMAAFRKVQALGLAVPMRHGRKRSENEEWNWEPGRNDWNKWTLRMDGEYFKTTFVDNRCGTGSSLGPPEAAARVTQYLTLLQTITPRTTTTNIRELVNALPKGLLLSSTG